MAAHMVCQQVILLLLELFYCGHWCACFRCFERLEDIVDDSGVVEKAMYVSADTVALLQHLLVRGADALVDFVAFTFCSVELKLYLLSHFVCYHRCVN